MKTKLALIVVSLLLGSSAVAGTMRFPQGSTLVSISLYPTSWAMNIGESVRFNATLTGATIPNWLQWYLNDTYVPGATTTSWTFTPPTRGTYQIYIKAYPSVNDTAYNVAQSETARVIVGGQAFTGVLGYPNGSSQASGSGTQYDAFGSRFMLNVEANITSISCLMRYSLWPYDSHDNCSYRFAIYRDDNGTVGSLVAQTDLGTIFHYDHDLMLWWTLDLPSVVHLAPSAYWLMTVQNETTFVMVSSAVIASYQSVDSFLSGTTYPNTLPSPIYSENYVFSIYASWAVNISASLSPDTNDFSIASNSTVSPLTYGSSANEVTFNVSGSSGTMGYTEAFVSKTLLPDINEANITLDGTTHNFTATSIGDSWVLYFVYPHSAHKVTISMQPSAVPEFPAPLFASMFVMISVAVLVYFKKRKRQSIE